MKLKLRATLATAALLGAVISPAQAGDLLITEDGQQKTCTISGNVVLSSTGDVTLTVGTGCLAAPAPPPAGTFTLSVTKNGTGTGTVTSSPAGISCGSTCSANIAESTAVTLTAAPSNGATVSFAGCDSTPTATTCAVTMSAAKSITATFTASAPPPGGGDPGTGVYQPNSTTYVIDRGSLSELYVPRCVPTQYNNCKYGGNQSQFDTIRAGEVWAVRIPYGADPALTMHLLSLARTETGETLNAFDMALSTTIGDFNVAGACYRASGGTLYLYDPANGTPRNASLYCPLSSRNTTYYLNIRPAVGSPGATQCGSGAANGCRVKVVLPSTIDYSDD